MLLAYEMNGAPLPPQHGFPLRLVVPGWYGMAHVKWLSRDHRADRAVRRATSRPSATGSTTPRTTPGAPVTRMLPRSLMVPPGIPDFMTRARFVDAGPCRLEGRAWSGWGPIERVEVSTDGGATWADARLDAPLGAARVARLDLRLGRVGAGRRYVLCLARDGRGGQRPARRPPWNLKGYANNAVERVPVTVRAA